MPVSGIPITPPHYGSRAGIEQEFGVENVKAWADINSTGSAQDIADGVESGLLAADQRVALRAWQLRAPIPSIASPGYSELGTFSNVFAGIWLRRRRGEPSENSKVDAAYNSKMEQAEKSLAAALLTSRATSGITGQYDVAPAAIASGSNVAALDRAGPLPYSWGWPWNWWG